MKKPARQSWRGRTLTFTHSTYNEADRPIKTIFPHQPLATGAAIALVKEAL